MTSLRFLFASVHQHVSLNAIPFQTIRTTMKCFTTANNLNRTPTPDRFISLDVECVSTGKNVGDKAICSVGIVDYNCKVLLDKLIKPSVPVTDYLTRITGFTEESLVNGEKEEDVLQEIYSLLDENVVLVGQSPQFDIDWLKVRFLKA